ncbi:MAG: hypothetical protein NTY38_04685, partial [Acidobacteria bacterium]|nr:hypothetical protein [Acidobacteriota bacterium]
MVGSVFGAGQGTSRISYAAGSGRHAEGLNLSYRIGDPLPGVITASVTSNLGSVPFGHSASAAWIQVTASQAQTPATLQIQINPTGLAAGTYVGTLTVTTTVLEGGRIVDWRDTSTITLIVTPAPPSTPAVAPLSLSFSGGVGQPVAPKTLQLTSAPSSLAYTATASQPWIAVSPATGVTGGAGVTLTVSVDTGNLPAGVANGQISISLPGGTPAILNVPVSLSLVQAATDIVPPTVNLTGSAQQGSPAILLGSFSPAGASNANIGFSVAVPANAASWLSATPPAGTTPANVQVYASAQSLVPGNYNSTLQVTLSNASPASYSIPVSFTVTAPPPVVFGVSLSSFDLAISTLNPASTSVVPVTVSATQGTESASASFTVASDQPWL